MAKITNISGFPEWLPEHKLLEEEICSSIRTVYESFGFVPIETPAVELVDTLTSKGVVDKELYVVKRLKAEDGEEAELGLHFDLTVPFARYVAQHFNELVFPFRRYQLQKVWRGERPQKGRFREFYQFDADVVARDELPLSCEAEILTMAVRSMENIAVGEFSVLSNNRKLLRGVLEYLQVEESQQPAAVRAIDKLDKIGPVEVKKELAQESGLSSGQCEELLELCSLETSMGEAVQQLESLGVNSPLFLLGKEEIALVAGLLDQHTAERVKLKLNLARGLDYYTGLIFEIHLRDYPDFGSVGGGGRYEDLVSQYLSKKVPGCGFSIGVSRLMDLIIRENLRAASRKSSAKVLVSVLSEEQRKDAFAFADKLRTHGISTEVFYRSPKLGKQIEYAEKKGIRYVVFLADDGSAEIKDLETKEQRALTDLGEFAHSLLAL